MPCYSRITQTQMSKAERILEAGKALGLPVTISADSNQIMVGAILLAKGLDGTYLTSTSDLAGLRALGRRYAELTARSWGAQRGLVVRASTDKSITLVSTRS